MSAEQQEGTETEMWECSGPPVTEPRKMTPEEAEEMKRIAKEDFDYYDFDKSGYIEVSDVVNVTINKWIPEEQIKGFSAKFVQDRDVNADSKVSFDELYNALLKERGFEV